MTFDSPLYNFTPFPLTSTDRQIIAPFFADVDTRGSGSNAVSYGTGTYEGHAAFGANWVNVGYWYESDDKLNSFQLLVDRSDTGGWKLRHRFNYPAIRFNGKR